MAALSPPSQLPAFDARYPSLAWKIYHDQSPFVPQEVCYVTLW